jgi:Cys-rich protein (TIGR01571 family)
MLTECSREEMEKINEAPPTLVIDVEPVEEVSSKWNSGLCSCQRDEETLWWGFWCCWLLQGRTASTFEVDSSQRQINYFWCYITGIVICLMFLSPGSAILFTIAGALMLAYNRSVLREKIRKKYLIPGSFCDDFLTHSCCSCCAVCQEAREGKIRVSKTLDFCSGEDLLAQEEAYQRAIGHGERGIADGAVPEGGNFLTHIKSLSITSKIILLLSVIVACLSFILLIVGKKSQNIAVLFFVFLQPIIILYIVYWRARRQYASLDIVVKCYAVGFWFTTLQSMILESVLQGVLVLIFSPFLGPLIAQEIYSPGASAENVRFDSNIGYSQYQYNQQYVLRNGDINTKNFQENLINVGNNILFFYNSVFNNEGNPISSYNPSSGINLALKSRSFLGRFGGLFGGHFSNAFSDTMHQTISDTIDMASSADDQLSAATSQSNDGLRTFLKSHIVLVIIMLLLMAFVVAAGVEETMKHFIVRCCPFNSPLKDPHTVLVYLMAGALGFATFENIEYVFGTNSSPIPGTSMFVGELLVLLARICMPIHVICSVLQSVNLAKVSMGNSQMSLFRILLPAILLHGTFDFTLFLMGVVEFIYDVESTSLEVVSLVIAGILTVGGAIYAYNAFKNVENDFKGGYGVFSTEDEALARYFFYLIRGFNWMQGSKSESLFCPSL